ncbi:MAG: universal stress protein, partial [Lentisphaerota bacterium]
MIKSLLVCTDGSTYGDVACQYAVDLTQKLQGQLAALHVLDSRMLEGPLMSDLSGWVGAQPFGTQLQQFRDLLQQKGETVIEAFQARCKEAGITAEGLLKMGHPVTTILQEETRYEMLVLGQKGEHAEWIGELSGSSVEQVVRHSIKPCLVTPGEFKPITKILTAYDGSGHSSKALHEAIELAVGLKVPLSILTVAEDKDYEKANALTKEGLKLAQAHNCIAAHLVAKGAPDAAILDVAEKHHFDLIVMGAYGHSRIRE